MSKLKRSFNYDDARYMRFILKMTYPEICKHLGLKPGSRTAVQRACLLDPNYQAGVFDRRSPENLVQLETVREARSLKRERFHHSMVRLHSVGRNPAQIADEVGCSQSQVRRILKSAGLLVPNAKKPGEPAKKREVYGRTIPRWVHDADLVEDFRDVKREFGEEAAASHCRRLKAEAQRWAA